ncbi:hypothetical protein [Mesorhizobium sp. 8]|uniref:hypothetical protein n=1 Tax=Mesorhizobium sp. 8 TaxID=2584466 RepID=UPI00111E26FB|nr:hypothetical protein [Mesorhizobium sp. 8]QDC01654.1 hypothetical protein FGU64_15145 [Mesorhizobium sp. 8]
MRSDPENNLDLSRPLKAPERADIDVANHDPAAVKAKPLADKVNAAARLFSVCNYSNGFRNVT